MKAVFFLLLFINIVLFLYETTTSSQSSGKNGYTLDPNLQGLQLPGKVDLNGRNSDLDFSIMSTPIEKQPVSHIVDNDNDTRLTTDNDVLVASNQFKDLEIVVPSKVNTEIKFACFKVGIFNTEASAEKALRQLESQVTQGQIEVRTRQVPEGFWVVYPAAETFEESQANFDMLSGRGMNDLFLFERGALRGAISLGWFKVEAYAAEVLRKYRKQGLKVKMKTKSVEVNEYSILFESRQTTQQLREILDAGTEDLQVRQLQSCKALESGSPPEPID